MRDEPPGVATSAAHLGLRPADVRCEAPSPLQDPHGDPEEGRVDGPPVPRSHAGRASSSGRPLLPPRPQREGIRVMRLRTRLAALALSLLGLSGLAALAADPPAPKGKPLAVLFLGDKGTTGPPIAPRSSPRSSPGAASTSPTPRRSRT